jgi:hypothetical protein
VTIDREALRRLGKAAFTLASVALAARLFVPAAMLAVSHWAAEEFRASGLPGWTRLALAVPELCGAVLILVPRAFHLGAAILALDLAGAIAAHLSVGMHPTGLYLLMGSVLLLALARGYFSPWKRPQ